MIKIILFVLLIGTFAFAYEPDELTPKQQKAEQAAVIAKAKTSMKKNTVKKAERIEGIIIAVNKTKKTITIETAKKYSRTILVNKTIIKKFYVGQKIKALIRGNHVDVRIIKE